MIAALERFTGLGWRDQSTAWLVAFGHGATHWWGATVYMVLPYLTIELGYTYTEVGLLISALHIASFGANFGSGMVVDVTGRRVLVQVVSLIVGAAALLAFASGTNIVLLIFFISIIGAMTNLWHPAAISFLSAVYPKNRGYALSIHTLGASMGDSLAPIVVGSFLTFLTWRDAAMVSAIPIICAAIIIMFTLLRSERSGDSKGGSRVGVGDYFRGLWSMYTDKVAMGLCLMAGFRSMAQSGLLMFIPIYLANVLKVGPFVTGLALFFMQLGGFIAGPLAGAWSDKIGRRPIVLAAATGTTIVIAFLAIAQNEYLFIAGVSALGFVLFAMRPVIHSWMMDLTPAEMHGSATSALFGTQSALSAAIPVLGGWVADTYGVGAVFYLLAALMLVANVVVGMLPKDEERPAV